VMETQAATSTGSTPARTAVRSAGAGPTNSGGSRR